MKVVSRNFSKGGEGFVKLIPEHEEDMWHVYNLVRVGDSLTANSMRKVSRESGKGSETETVRVKLTVKVESVEFDADGGEIRARGKNVAENEHVRLGAYHTLVLAPNRQFSLCKENWDTMDIDRLKQASDPSATADLAVLLITEGLAQLWLVGGSTTVQRARIEVRLPRKRGPAIAGYDKSWESFLEKVFRAVIQHVNFEVVRCLVIAGPGFSKEGFKQYLERESVKQGIKPLMDNRDRVLLAPASSAYKHSLQEVLTTQGIVEQIKDTAAVAEVKALEEFHQTLADDSARAFYGPTHVLAAAEMGAIDALLISDNLFRSSDAVERQKYVKVVEDVRETGGKAFIFSAAHVSGEQLSQLSGIAAILRYPLPEIEEMEIPVER
eukprot:evm.model.scf_865.6 EVM.evm.TU.scf_865.6   scf_865:57648-61269(+)